MDCHEAIDRMGEALEGTLAGRTRAALDDHLDECAACGTYFDQLRLIRAVLRQLPRQAEKGEARSELIAAYRREFPRGG